MEGDEVCAKPHTAETREPARGNARQNKGRGTCDGVASRRAQAPGKKVKSYTVGGSFGELALMYNARRAAVRRPAHSQAPHTACADARLAGGRERPSFDATLVLAVAQSSDHAKLRPYGALARTPV
eukprot:6947233-Prymnesium_polylepis.1